MMVFNLSVVDTTPGAPSPMAPPEGWEGDRASYAKLMRARYDEGSWTQAMVIMADNLDRSGREPQMVGPWAYEALEIIKRVKKELRASRAERQAA